LPLTIGRRLWPQEYNPTAKSPWEAYNKKICKVELTMTISAHIADCWSQTIIQLPVLSSIQ
jgi:hypothetical protein